MVEKLNKQAITDLGDEYRVERYEYLYLLYKLGNVIYQTSDSWAMILYIHMLSKKV